MSNPAETKLLTQIVDAWERLEGGRQQSLRDVEKWLERDMAPSINDIRRHLGRKKPDGSEP